MNFSELLVDYLAPVVLFLISIITVFGRLRHGNENNKVTRIGYFFIVLAVIALVFALQKSFSDRRGSTQREILQKEIRQLQDSIISQNTLLDRKQTISFQKQDSSLTEKFDDLLKTILKLNSGELHDDNAARKLVGSIVDLGLLSQDFNNQDYQNVIKVNFDRKDEWKIADKDYSIFGTVYCSFGRSSTEDGYELFDNLNGNFLDYLNEHSVTTKVLEKESKPNWHKTLYAIKTNTTSETILGTETEWSPNGASGYFKIYLLLNKENSVLDVNSDLEFKSTVLFRNFVDRYKREERRQLIDGNKYENRFKWSGREFNTLFQIKSERRSHLNSVYDRDLNELFGDYLKEKKWVSEAVDNDNYGPNVYRVMTKSVKGNDEFSWAFVAENKSGDWSQEIIILKDGHRFKRIFK